MKKTLVAVTLAALSITGLSTPAAADTLTVRVSYADLNVASEDGMRALEGRLKSAYRKICGRPPIVGLVFKQIHNECLRELQESVEPQLARLARGHELASAGTIILSRPAGG